MIITSLDRLGRDAAETLSYVQRFARGKLGLVSIIDRLDLSSPHGRAMAGVAAVFGQLEREMIGRGHRRLSPHSEGRARSMARFPSGLTGMAICSLRTSRRCASPSGA